MNYVSFSSESYSRGGRAAAWQSFLRDFGLNSTLTAEHYDLHAAAAVRGAPEAVMIARFAATAQILTPARRRPSLPLLLLPLEGDLTLSKAEGPRHAGPGDLLILPHSDDWKLVVPADFHAAALSVDAAVFGSRKIGGLSFRTTRLVQARGLAGVLAGALEAAAEDLETLSGADWSALDLGLAEMLLELVRGDGEAPGERGRNSSQSAILHRICQTIERRLAEPDLTPAKIAHAEGISERYLQKLFEQTGDNFTHYLRERRLQRVRNDLANPTLHHLSISELAFQTGFNDAAHFSRAFRERFGTSPRNFRQSAAAEPTTTDGPTGQRGWPQEALAQARTRHGRVREESRKEASPSCNITEANANTPHHHHLEVDAAHVHWGFFSRNLSPVLTVDSGDTVSVETLTQHASDAPELMILGDPGAESVFRWTASEKAVVRRGAGPMDASIYGRGPGEGFGVHICTGPIAIRDAQPGDVLEVRILDIAPRPSQAPGSAGRVFGSSVSAWWGFHYSEFLAEPKPRETVTIYEIFADDPQPHARAAYSYRWAPQRDPSGVLHKTYDYPGVPVQPESVQRRGNVLSDICIPLRPHFGVIGLAPREADLIDSIPPAYFGGNIDNWRLGKGSAVFLPVSVPGALLSIGDPHAAQGDGELAGTAIECSMTGTLQVILHKKPDVIGGPFADLTYPLIETPTEWVLTGFSHPNYLAEFGAKGQSEVYAKSSLDLAMKDAFRKMRRFLMSARGLDEDEAIALMSAAVDFGVTQVVDGNWGVHALVRKSLFSRPILPR